VENGHIIASKNWPLYNAAAEFTDRFSGTGGSAGSAFNAQTDGGTAENWSRQ